LNTLVQTDVSSVQISDINVNNPALFRDDNVHAYFKRLREEDPVHFYADSKNPYWSITKYEDIVAIDSNHRAFSSQGTTVIEDDFMSGGPVEAGVEMASFIMMDPPKHDEHRKVVSPAVAPANLLRLEPLIRSRVRKVLDDLPIGEEFDWVPRVSVELTTQMLATLFDFPFEERSKLTFWSNVATGIPGDGLVESWEHRNEVLREMSSYFRRMWRERQNSDAPDLLSMLARSPYTAHMSEQEFVGTLVLLIVGGNDTTRNSMAGGALAFNDFPAEWGKLKANPALLSSAIPEIVRWQSPIIYQRRTASEDIDFGGKTIRKGDRVAMWYLSGNRDGNAIDRPDEFIVNRERPRQHLSFGFGIHRCVGNRLAELQLHILWDEALKRFSRIEVTGHPERLYSTIIRGFVSLPVKLHA
jgi:cytochrome P450